MLTCLRKFLSSIPLIFIGYILLEVCFPTSCYSVDDAERVLVIFLILVYAAILLGPYLFIIFGKKEKSNINRLPFYTTLILALIFLLLKLLYPDYILGKEIMRLGSEETNKVKIILRDNKTCDLIFSNTKVLLVNRFKYSLTKDTLSFGNHFSAYIHLESGIFKDEMHILSDKYVIDKVNGKLYPIDSSKSKDNIRRWLSMEPLPK